MHNSENIYNTNCSHLSLLVQIPFNLSDQDQPIVLDQVLEGVLNKKVG